MSQIRIMLCRVNEKNCVVFADQIGQVVDQWQHRLFGEQRNDSSTFSIFGGKEVRLLPKVELLG